MDTSGSYHHVGETRHLSALRIVLLGAKECGKSSAGNSILGKQAFTPGIKTTACQKGQGDVAGREITVVDTPGWVRYFPVEDSAELLKEQIVCSVSLCPPGPHAVLLVINLDSSFQEKHRRSVQGHLELLSDTVWRHTVLLFTFGDTLSDQTVEQHIESEGQALQGLIQKCGNRYHGLSNSVSQVPELLVVVEEMVVEEMAAGQVCGLCAGGYFHMEPDILQDMENKRSSAEKRANQRVRKVRERRETIRDLQKGGTCGLPELRVVLLGWVAAGKCSTGNNILGREEFGAWRRTAQCEKKQGADERKARWDSAGVEEMDQKHSDEESHTAPWKTEKAWAFLHNEIKGIFETEWSRKEDTIKDIIRTEIKSYITPPAKETSMSCGIDFGGEPDTPDVAVSCMKVYDWLREKHSGNSAAESGYETSSETSNRESSDITAPRPILH
ncbi:GTPase IMAP family member 4-like isoform X2 [Conger conger]|uniref:GTPase IMAP family member 4-like isoform X2 n=1 Tax=Conger conger TaxID=82655 RepID=UPI002A5AFDD5|nr:GTPase IMAP family member 4-like isoform X2 [Conger conger]